VSNIEKLLKNDEGILYETDIHPFFYLPYLLILCVCLLTLLAGLTSPNVYLSQIGVIGLLFVFLPAYAFATVEKKNTGLVITEKRVLISSFGIIKRKVTELTHKQIRIEY